MERRKFSVGARLRSFRFAAEGVRDFFLAEHNAWLHLTATVAVIIAAWWTGVSETEALALVLVVGLVWVAEMFNTCIERIADMISMEQHPKIRLIKDVSAGAVLLAACTALITGIIIFFPKWFAG